MVNGSIGIAAGFAVNIPPHNIIEVCEGTIFYIEKKIFNKEKVSIKDLLQIIKGPDYPTSGIVSNNNLEKIYTEGEGKIYLRSKITYNEKNNTLLITEIPYGNFTDDITESIKDAIENKLVSGIVKITDQSSSSPYISLKLKNDIDHNSVINQLYQYTHCQVTKPVILLGIKNKELIKFSLLDSIKNFINFRFSCIIKALNTDLENLKKNLEIYEGFYKAFNIIDKIIVTIKKCENEKEVISKLISVYNFTKLQAEKIAEMKLSKLAKFSVNEIIKNLENTKNEIEKINKILSNKKNIYKIIIKEQKEIIEYCIKNKMTRKTKLSNFSNIKKENIKQLYPNKDYYIGFTKNGFIKKFSKDVFETQNRNGKGKSLGKLKENDYIINIQPCKNHDKIFVFSEKGIIYSLDVYKFEETDYRSIGRHISSYLNLKDNEKISSIVFCSDKDWKNDNNAFIFLTEKALIKKTNFSEFRNIHETGIIALKIKENDRLLKADIYYDNKSEKNSILIASRKCRVTRFLINEKELPNSLRPAFGKTALRLKEDDLALDFAIKYENDNNKYVLSVTSGGIGKKTIIDTIGTKIVKRNQIKKDENGNIIKVEKKEVIVENTETGYPIKFRGSKGYTTMVFKENEKETGELVSFLLLGDKTEINIMTKKKIIKINSDQIKPSNRRTKGLRIIKLNKDDKVLNVNIS